MARIVLGMATSHSPLLGMKGADWEERSRREVDWPRVNRIDGSYVSYAELHAEVGDRYADIAVASNFLKQAETCQNALDRLGDDLAAANPDIVIVVGDDQGELFNLNNFPALSIFNGDELVNRVRVSKPDDPGWQRDVYVSRGMEMERHYPAAPAFASELIERMIEKEIDVAVSKAGSDPLKSGLGHAVGFVLTRVFRGKSIPVIPVLLNTYFQPNVPTPARCYKIGQALRQAIEECPADFRIAVVASGGLSHFLCEEAFDRKVLAALASRDVDTLCNLPRKALISGTSEILNWVLVGGAVEGLESRWTEYVPVYRTPAGTGIGLGFAVWS